MSVFYTYHFISLVNKLLFQAFPNLPFVLFVSYAAKISALQLVEILIVSYNILFLVLKHYHHFTIMSDLSYRFFLNTLC